MMIRLWLHSTIVNHTGARSEWEFVDSQLPLSKILELPFSENGILRQSIVDETGALRQHINIFVGYRNVRKLQGLDTLIEPGDEISIFPSVSGG